MSLQILQFKGKSLPSKAIKLFTWGEYSHSAVLNTSNGSFIEAWTSGVRMVSVVNHFHTPNTEVDVFDIKLPYDKTQIWKDLCSEIGKGYDFSGIFGFLGRLAAQSNDRWFCSELVFSKFARSGALLLNCPAYKVDPTLLSYSPYLELSDRIILK